MVTCDSTLRRVTHYHYTAWPDFGNPPTDSFLELTRAVGATSRDKPIVVHCSAGLGRTGVFVTVHTALECFRDKRKVDIKEIGSKIRKQREGMIQSQDQFRFCFEAVANELSPEQEAQLVEVTVEPITPALPSQTTGDIGRSTAATVFTPDSFSTPVTHVEDHHPSSVMATPLMVARASPPPPSSSPPPPISAPETPLKAQLSSSTPPSTPSIPEITFTGPTPRSSQEETDRELIQRKLDSMAAERDSEEERLARQEDEEESLAQGRQRIEKEIQPDRDSVASITQHSPMMKSEPPKETMTQAEEFVQPPKESSKEAKAEPKQESQTRKPKSPVVEKKGERPQAQKKGKDDKHKTSTEAEKPHAKEREDKLKAHEPPKKEEAKEMKAKTEAPKETSKVQQKKDKEGESEVSKNDKLGVSEAKEDEREKEEEVGFSIGDDPLDFKPPPKKSLKDQKQPKPPGQQSWKYQRKTAPSPTAPPAPSPATPKSTVPEKKKRPPTPKQQHRAEVVKSEPEVYTKVVGKITIPSIFGSAATQSPAPSPQASPKPSPRRFGHAAATTKNENEPQPLPVRKPPAFGQRVLPLISPRPPIEPQATGSDNKEPGADEKPRNVLDMIKQFEGVKKPASQPAPTYKLPTLSQKATWTAAASSAASSSKPTYKLPTTPSQKLGIKPPPVNVGTESKPGMESKPDQQSTDPSRD